MTSRTTKTSKIDYGLVLTIMLLCLVSLISIYSAQKSGQYSGNFVMKQGLWYIVGTGLIILTVQLDSDQLKKLSWYSYGFGLFLLILLIIAPSSIAPHINGAKSWFKVPFMGTLQPSEFMKVFFILALSRVVTDHHQKFIVKTVKTDFWLLVKIGIVTMAPL